MFDNIGSKIKTVAYTLTVIGIFLSILVGLLIMLDGEISGLLVMIFGSLFSWLGSFMLYGFGQLVENSDKMVALLEELSPGPDSSESTETIPIGGSCTAPVSQSPADWVCFSCGNSNFHSVQTCQRCGVTKYWSEAKHAEAATSIPF